MKLLKKLIPYIAGAIAIVLLIIFMPHREKEKKFVGRVTLDSRDKNPYGCNAAFQLLQERFPGTHVVRNQQEPAQWEELSWDTAKAGQVLMIVAKFFDPSETDLNYLTSFAQKGNYVFISVLEMSDIAKKFFRVDQDPLRTEQPWIRLEDNSVTWVNRLAVKLDSATFQPPYLYGYPGAPFSNTFFGMDSSFTYQIGTNAAGKANLLAMNTLDGTIFLHSAPLALSNFFILYRDNHEYFEKLMSLFPRKPTKIVWDEYFLYGIRKEEEPKGLLSVILQYENFRWAFWLVLLVLGLYLVTAVKRKQRMIPVYRKPANDSLEFVETIGKLYYEKGDHRNLALKMTQFFLEHVRTKYKIDTHYINDDFATVLSMKSGVTKDTTGAIVDYIHKAQMGLITRDELMKFYYILDHFYKHT
ncbi:DUF4350 domain-containing protein [Filimonas effusa]|uniref:DUF4350 domain-containing protein n=1 Tax=Filimonas effusa TaxID=2508721 RepID=A0A4V1MAL9_9BACT|nr:DUF4350 domain-containing protein [Filimonas effusa]RXK86336.1 DUF4350 domain-containing protein [Filimonas effusa]